MDNISFKQTVESNGVTINATFEVIISEERIIEELEKANYKTSKENIEKFSEHLKIYTLSVNEDSLKELFIEGEDDPLEPDMFETIFEEYGDELESEDEEDGN